jgi:FkbM family methyltransferase
MGFLNSFQINLIFDVGANEGQFAKQMRTSGYDKRIVSFEPLSAAFVGLLEHTKTDPLWEAANCALGDYNGKAEINISANSWSSSLLDMLQTHEDVAPDSKYIGKETINITTIDSIIENYRRPKDRLFLKIDTQGFGQKVLDGAEQSLEQILGIQMEMSLVPLYKDEPLLGDIIVYLYRKGYTLMSIEPEYFDSSTGQQMQINGLFFRNK